MNTVITYDISDDKRRNRFRKFLKEMGVMSQKSVYECRLDRHEIRRIRLYCKQNLDLEKDSVRIYRVCARCMNKAVIQGRGLKFSQLDWVVI